MKVLDIEADSLNPTHIDCVCTIDVDTGVEYVWRYDRLDTFDLSDSDVYIGHNILGYDLPNLNRLMGCSLLDSRCVDTLVCSRCFASHLDGHSLDDWGKRLGIEKGEFNEFSRYDDPDLERDRMDRCVSYCLQDCRVTLALYNFLKKYINDPDWSQALRCEHDTAVLCRQLHENGFSFDLARAKDIQSEISAVVSELSKELATAFPPRSELIRQISPKLTKHGTINRVDFRWLDSDDLTPYSAEAPFSLIKFVPFNPRSTDQVVDILNKAGWEPYEKTQGHKDTEKKILQLRRNKRNNKNYVEELRRLEANLDEYRVTGWKVSEENLATLPADAPKEIQLFVKYRMLSKRLDTLSEWFTAYNPDTRKIHGTFHPIGAWTHRKSHSNPNQGNVPSIDSKYHAEELKELAKKYGIEMRSCFTASPGMVLVGVDADAIQLRVLAHYMGDENFIEALVKGDKKLGTDAHSLNAVALGFTTDQRNRAKTFIYAWLLGAGVAKVAKILGIGPEEARERIQQFINYYGGLRRLKEQIIPSDAARGYFTSFDGRKIKSDEYHMLAGYLQAGESVIMKHAAIKWNKDLKDDQCYFRMVNDVHDEWQSECLPADAGHVSFTKTESIRYAGEKFGLKIPLLGQSKYGLNWYETH